MSLVVAEDLFRFYHVGDAEIRALKGVSLTLGAGEIVALTGPSGSGKSTLLSCLCGLDEPDGGTVAIAGRRMTRRPEAEKSSIRAASLGILSQRDNLFAHLTVAENLAFAMEANGRRRDAIRIHAALRDVALAHRANAYPATLSGGETARAGLAVALVLDAPVLVADEPTAEVDEATERLILNLLLDRSRRGLGAIVATHSEAVAAVATRRLALRDGHLSEAPAGPVAVRAGALRDRPAPADRDGRTELICGRALSRRFDVAGQAFDAVAGVDIVVHRGDRIAVTGPSGSGKSTLLGMLGGLIPPSAGRVVWHEGWASDGLRPAHVGIVSQEPSLIATLTVRENVALPLQLTRSSMSGRVRLSPEEALAVLGLTDIADKRPDEISGGQAQRVAFARALVTNPDVVLADEPTGQLDRPTADAVMEEVMDAFDRRDTALLVTTHDERLAGRMSTRFHLNHGRVAAFA